MFHSIKNIYIQLYRILHIVFLKLLLIFNIIKREFSDFTCYKLFPITSRRKSEFFTPTLKTSHNWDLLFLTGSFCLSTLSFLQTSPHFISQEDFLYQSQLMALSIFRIYYLWHWHFHTSYCLRFLLHLFICLYLHQYLFF